ncbi:MAG: hypothetical protein ACI4PG_02390 [Candidatus Ventricola sp.]
MSLFGRRKPGFSKEVELRPEDITDEFSDRNDPAMQRNSNPKEEKAELAARAQAVMEGTACQESAASGAQPSAEAPDLAAQAAAEGRTVDLFDYMDSLPEAEDPFPPSEPEQETPPEPERKPGEILAEYIRERSRAAQLTPRKALAEEEPQLEEMLEEMRGIEACADIRSVQGSKDEYFYSEEIMANNYAMIAMLVLEKDIARTVAHMVRFNCRTYPSPTPLYHFMRSPYSYTKPQLEQALRVLKAGKDSQDIKTVVAFNDVLYMYSTDIMSERYAKALADGNEAGEADF